MGLRLHRQQTADAGADDRADPIRICVVDLKAGMGHSLLAATAELAEPIPALGFFRFDEAGRIEILHLRRKAAGVCGCIEQGDGVDSVAAGGEPVVLNRVADRCDRAEAGDDDAMETIHHCDAQACLSSMYLTASPTVVMPSAASSRISMSKASSRPSRAPVSRESAPDRSEVG